MRTIRTMRTVYIRDFNSCEPRVHRLVQPLQRRGGSYRLFRSRIANGNRPMSLAFAALFWNCLALDRSGPRNCIFPTALRHILWPFYTSRSIRSNKPFFKPLSLQELRRVAQSITRRTIYGRAQADYAEWTPAAAGIDRAANLVQSPTGFESTCGRNARQVVQRAEIVGVSEFIVVRKAALSVQTVYVDRPACIHRPVP
jgi:hypothetical protein